jgi:hypothetical protein
VPLRANWILYQIQNLYRIEARLRKSKAGPALRAVVRTAQSAMVLNRLKRALEKWRPPKGISHRAHLEKPSVIPSLQDNPTANFSQ